MVFIFLTNPYHPPQARWEGVGGKGVGKNIYIPALKGLTLGWKNEKQPSGPIELDLEAGNLVLFLKYCMVPKLS